MAKAKSKKRKSRIKKAPDFLVDQNGHAQIVGDIHDNPYAYGAGNPVQRVKTLVNRKCHPLVEYYNRGWITFAAKEVGLKFEATYALSGATTKALDYSKEPVDTSGAPDAFTDQRISAINRLLRADALLGRAGYMLIEQVCGHGQYVKDISRNDHQSRQEMARLKHCLYILAENW